jgi:predicted Rossmann-fold nucleotide-binding protein
VIFPGGYGTLDELFEALTLIQTRKIAPIPVVFVGEEYWSRVIDFEFLEIEGVIDSEDRELFWFASSAKEAWEGIVEWHIENKTPLYS